MNDIYYSNEVDSYETLPLLLGKLVHASSSESEARINVTNDRVSHSLPHSIINHCVNKKGRLDVHTLYEQECSRPTQHNDKGVMI